MKKGFTLGEIFTALIIIGILIAAISPSFKNLTDPERRESILFKKSYYALERAVEAMINNGYYYKTGSFSDVSKAVDADDICIAACYTSHQRSKFYDIISKQYFNVIRETQERPGYYCFIIKDNVKYCMEIFTFPNVGDCRLQDSRTGNCTATFTQAQVDNLYHRIDIYIDDKGPFMVGVGHMGNMRLEQPLGSNWDLCNREGGKNNFQCKAKRYLERQGI